MKRRWTLLLAAGLLSLVALVGLWSMLRPPRPARLSISFSAHNHVPGHVPTTVFVITNPSLGTLDFEVLPLEFQGAGGWQTQVVSLLDFRRIGRLKPGETARVVIDSAPSNTVWRVAITSRPTRPAFLRRLVAVHLWPDSPFRGEKIAGPEMHPDEIPGQAGPANGSQPIRSETNRTSSAAGSRR